VILWADTFNNHFTPDIARAGLRVLEHAGFDVRVPKESLCCGRPLYDHGMLGLARRLLQQVMTVLRDEIEAGTPIVGLEPSCVAVFRDELLNLFPDDPLAKKLSKQVFVLAEFLQIHAPDWVPPQFEPGDKAVLHGHCHQKAVMSLAPDEALLKRMGLTVETPDSGCCGMAGSFGFSKEHYDVSVAVGERVLLPAVREAGAKTMIITDGFSCREQVDQETDREALHLAQVIAKALKLPEGP
jgi:Fe-S oxidoreductase